MGFSCVDFLLISVLFLFLSGPTSRLSFTRPLPQLPTKTPTKSSLSNRRHETGNCLARQFPVKVDGLTSARFPTKCEVFLRISSTSVYGGEVDIDRAVVVSRLFSRLTDVLTCNRCDVRLTSFRLHPPPACLSLQTGVCKDARWRGVRCKKG